VLVATAFCDCVRFAIVATMVQSLNTTVNSRETGTCANS